MLIKGFILLLISLVPVFAFATHLRGGEITIRQIQCNDYEITLSLYTDLNTLIVAGSGTLLFGDGASFNLPDLVNETIDAKLGVGRATSRPDTSTKWPRRPSTSRRHNLHGAQTRRNS